MAIENSELSGWKAPSEDGGVLLWIAGQKKGQSFGQRLVEVLEDNARMLDSMPEPKSGGVPLPMGDLRRMSFEYLRSSGERPSNNSESATSRARIIMTGHQVELYHPGVWIKNVLIDAAARLITQKNGTQSRFSIARGVHLSVDTDQPKHLKLRYLEKVFKSSGVDFWQEKSLAMTDDSEENRAWSGLLHPPTPEHVKQLKQSVKNSSRQWDYEPVVWDFFDDVMSLLHESQRLCDVLINAQHKADWQLGLDYTQLTASVVWEGEAFGRFVLRWLKHALKCGRVYNDSLDEYRREAGISSPGRPMPDLKIEQDDQGRWSVETPFWLDDIINGQRQRLVISVTVSDGGGWELTAGGNVFQVRYEQTTSEEELWIRWRDFCRRSGIRVAPRALTLTMFARLAMCDLFVHGIGGARYDMVTDRLISRLCGSEPPAYAVATATAYVPVNGEDTRQILSENPTAIRRSVRRQLHNPHGLDKAEYLKQVEKLPRNSLERRKLFYEMHRIRQTLTGESKFQARLKDKHAEADLLESEIKLLADREMFYLLQSDERLREMIATVREELGMVEATDDDKKQEQRA